MAIIKQPDQTIGKPGKDYMKRWYIKRDPATGNRYLHRILRSDEDRALHDHPWDNKSFIIWPGYIEHFPDGTKKRRWPLQIIRRKVEDAHRLELLKDRRGTERPCWTFFTTGPKRREWGFHCPKGWRHWREFVGLPAGEPTGQEIGRGCE